MINILSKIYNKSKDSFYQSIQWKLEKEEKAFIVTANPEIIMISQKDENIKNLLLQDEVTIIPDGIGIIKCGKKLGIHMQEKITGIDLIQFLFEVANKACKSVYFYGSKEETLEKLKKVLESKYPNIDIMGLKNGYDYSEEEVFEEIQQKKPDLFLVAMGVPTQESIINTYYSKLTKGICVGVGGSLDVLSGNKTRAPLFIRNMNLEWLYRVIKEPIRIKRFCKYNLKFYMQSIKMKRGRK